MELELPEIKRDNGSNQAKSTRSSDERNFHGDPIITNNTVLFGIPHLRNAIWTFFEDPDSSRPAKYWSIFIIAVIAIAVGLFCVETLPQFHESGPFWDISEAISVSIFTLEFVFRLASTPSYLKFAKTPMNYVDVAAILPFYIALLGVGGGLGIIRVIRLVRVLRVFKLGRHTSKFGMVLTALRRSVDALGLMLFLMGISVVVFSSVMYYAEQTQASFDEELELWVYNDGDTSPFQSIPHSMWWAVVTLTTVGYGDLYPITVAGKLAATVTMLSGILVISFPVAILSNNFLGVWKDANVSPPSRSDNPYRENKAFDEVPDRVIDLLLFKDEIGQALKHVETSFSHVRNCYEELENSTRLLVPPEAPLSI